MKKYLNRKYMFPAAVVFLLTIVVLGVRITYGAYVRRSYIKAVIATNETEKLFGSNLLYGIKNQPKDPGSDSWLSVYPYTVSDPDQEEITVPLKIYNFLAEDEDRINQLDVSYIISFRIVGSPSTNEEGHLDRYSVNGHTFASKDIVYYLGKDGLSDNKSDAVKQVLPGRLLNVNEYELKFPGADLGKISIAVKAERVSNNDGSNQFGTDLLFLAARIVPGMVSTVETATVKGEFTYHTGFKPEDYAAYNYTVELTGSPTAVVISWNQELLEIDPFFQEKYGDTVTLGENQVVFNMEPGNMKVQFYRKGNVADKDWEDLGVSVTER